MDTNKHSSFVREITNRLNALFGEDIENVYASTGPAAQKHEGGNGEAIAPELSGFLEEIKDKPVTVETERRIDFDLAVKGTEEQSGENELLKDITLDQGGEFLNQISSEMAVSKSILFSPIKGLKSIILYLEWEINESVLSKLDDECRLLEQKISEDHAVPGFLRIIRFLGRYLRVRAAEIDYRSIKLLISIYDDFERIMLSRDISADEKHSILLADIEMFKAWVETADLSPARPLMNKTAKETKEKEQAGSVEQPDRSPAIVKKNTPPEEMARAAGPVCDPGQEMTKAGNVGADTTTWAVPSEALEHIMEELKKTIRAEFRALKEELDARGGKST